jgi:hypothetical protein
MLIGDTTGGIIKKIVGIQAGTATLHLRGGGTSKNAGKGGTSRADGQGSGTLS